METEAVNKEQDLLILRQLTDILDELGIAYAVSGSLASSLYGAIRFTQDADIIVEPFTSVAGQFHDTVKSGFYISKAAMNEALQHCRSFNIIDLETAFKIDIFVQARSQYEGGLLDRSSPRPLSDSIDKTFNCLSPEDVVILKLRWYKQGGCASDRQWSDVTGVLYAQAGALDYDYLKLWAQKLELDELLKRAIEDSGA